MLQPETYKEWVSVSWPESSYDGRWVEGEEIRFSTPGSGGTLAKVEKLQEGKFISIRHIAVVNHDETLDQESDFAKRWIGTTEEYTFKKLDNQTNLEVVITTTSEWKSMFMDGWPNALAKLKEVCER